MPITALPIPPSRQDPANFSQRADDFMAALPTFATETNSTATTVNNNSISASASAVNAAASAAGANASANVSKWVSGTTYAQGDVEWSPVNFFSYRRKIAGAGTTDPSADTTNWALVSGAGDVSLTGTQTLTNKTFVEPVLGTPASGNLLNCVFPSYLAQTNSPTFTGSPVAPTAPKFSNDTQLATTAFVQNAIGNYGGSVAYLVNGNAILPADVGKVIILSAASTYVVTLPTLVAIPEGSSLSFVNSGTAAVSIQRINSDVIAIGGTVTISFSVGPGDCINVTKANGAWNVGNRLTAPGSAPVYGCRAWVNFNGNAVGTIRGSGNVSSITDNGVGDYTINFFSPMPDVGYSVSGSGFEGAGASNINATAIGLYSTAGITTTSVRVINANIDASTIVDGDQIHVQIHR